MFQSNQDFLDYLDEQYKGVDWDNLPDIESVPDIFEISGQDIKIINEREHITHFTLAAEYKTKEEAEAQIEFMKSSPVWSKTLWDTLKIKALKPGDITDLHIMNSLRKEALKKEKMFPIFLP